MGGVFGGDQAVCGLIDEGVSVMSVLNKMKSLSAQKSVQWVARHVLVTEAFELRLQYLACVALAVAPEREPNSQERLAFNGLAASLSIDAADATEQLNERANVSEEDMLGLFAIIKAKEMVWIYLLDVAWLHAVDGEVDVHEKEFLEAVAPMLEVRGSAQAVALQRFMLAVKQKKDLSQKEVMRLLEQLPQDNALHAMLLQLFMGRFSFVVLLHRDGSVIDFTSGLMWAVNTDMSPDFPNPEPMKWSDALAWPKHVNEKGWRGYKDWRLPTVDELRSLLFPASHRSGKQSQDICEDVFGDISSDDFIWTSSPCEDNGEEAWIVSDTYGATSDSKKEKRYVCVVRSAH